MKSRGGKSQRREEKRREEKRSEEKRREEKRREEKRRRKKKEERRSKRRKSQKKEDPGARKGRKAATRYVFPMVCGCGGSKNRFAKAAGAEPAGQMRDEKFRCGARHISKSKCTKHTSSGHVVVARSTSRSQKAQKHTSFGPLLEVEMSKNCTSWWREAHFEVKMYKTPQCGTTFGS